jgi:anti-sigma factor RsiW
MKSCDTIRDLLPLFSGGELDASEVSQVELHLAHCDGCRGEEETFSLVIASARWAGPMEHRIPSAIRSRIISQAVEGVSRRPWWLPLPGFSLAAHPGLLAGAAAVLLALVALPVAMRYGSGPAHRAEVSSIEIRADGGMVRLAWSDGSRDAYKVYKSNDPRNFGHGEVHVVRGNVWTDRQPGSGPIVYYRIE